MARITSQQRGIRARERRWQQHHDCAAQVRRRGPHWGVYCQEHGTWIQWIREDHVWLLEHDPATAGCINTND